MNLLALIHALPAADHQLGKFEMHSLSQQTLMELMIQDVYDKEQLCMDDENPRDVSEWYGLTLNGQKEVIQILWADFEDPMGGTLDFQKLPPTVDNFQVRATDLEGTLDCADLPQSLVIFCLMSNRFSGELDLCHLPQRLEQFSVQSNEFGGTLDLSCLPQTLWRLDLSLNQFFGKTDFDMLPDALVEIDVVFTQLSGTITRKNGRKIENYKSRVRIV